MSQTALVVGGTERTQVRIGGGGRFSDVNEATTIVWVIEIRIIPTVPDEVAIPHHVGIAKSEAHAEAGAEERAIAETIVGYTHAITEPAAIVGCGSVVSVGRIIVVKIRPAIVILGLHLDILVICDGAILRFLKRDGVRSRREPYASLNNRVLHVTQLNITKVKYRLIDTLSPAQSTKDCGEVFPERE